MKGIKFVFASILSLILSEAMASTPEAVPGEYVLKLKNSISFQKNINALENSLNVKIKRFLPNTNLVVVKTGELNNLNSKTTISRLMKNESVLIAEPNFIYRINRMPNDPEIGKLWGLVNSGQPDSSNKKGTAGVDIDVERAWDIETGNGDLLIAVIDTGVDYTHPDLKDNAWTNTAELNGKPGVDDDENGFIDDIHGYDFANHDADPMDDHGHGSHCSGTIAAKGNDGAGIVGVAWNAKIMGVKFLGADGGGTLEGAVEAIKYATKMGVKIMSNSWGGGGYSEVLKEAIKEAGDHGIVFTAAAGNSSQNNDATAAYPATYNLPNIISVAAMNNRGELADFSSYGKTTVHVAAPGVNVYSSIPGGYDSWSGTSMATPHVTGVAALLLSKEPNLNPEEVRTRLIRTSRPMSALKGKSVSNGMVNAYLALMNEQAPPDPNDPANWTSTYDLNISTEHKYKDNTNQSWEVEIPGANQIAILFENFKTETRYDKVVLTNRKGEKVGEITGDAGERWSYPIDGNYVKITFTSDGSVNDYGFDIRKAAYR